jgi:predicted transcriptional regulator
MKEHVAEIVSAYLGKNSVALSDIPAVITQVYQSLAELGQPQSAEPETPLQPAVPIRRSVNPEYITCLECGAKATMLRRHLMAAHNLTPTDYRERWKLATDYPLTAPSYAARRSEMAIAIGLGRTPGTRGRGSKPTRRRAYTTTRS